MFGETDQNIQGCEEVNRFAHSANAETTFEWIGGEATANFPVEWSTRVHPRAGRIMCNTGGRLCNFYFLRCARGPPVHPIAEPIVWDTGVNAVHFFSDGLRVIRMTVASRSSNHVE